MNSLAKNIGTLLILAGALVLLLSLVEVTRLYLDPDLIKAPARQLADATGIDAKLPAAIGQAIAGDDAPPIMVAYFLAWGLALILLSIAAKMGYLCIKAGMLLTKQEPREKATLGTKNGQSDPQDKVEALPLDYQPSHRKKVRN